MEDLSSRQVDHNGCEGSSIDSSGHLLSHQSPAGLPLGVKLRSLQTNRDGRGSLTEVFRASWDTVVEIVQWNYVESESMVLRGVHVHINHYDYLILLRGRASIGLRDLRRGSPTEGVTALIEMQGKELHAITIPPGIAHGFYFHEPSAHVYAVSAYWDALDELGCYWADPALGINWPEVAPIISARDANLPSLRELVEMLPEGR